MVAKTSVTKLAAVTGTLELKIPNKSHNSVPKVNKAYMEREIPDVSFVRMVFSACGKKESVVQKAATSPSIVTVFMFFCFRNPMNSG